MRSNAIAPKELSGRFAVQVLRCAGCVCHSFSLRLTLDRGLIQARLNPALADAARDVPSAIRSPAVAMEFASNAEVPVEVVDCPRLAEMLDAEAARAWPWTDPSQPGDAGWPSVT
ncbi:hypothetical protein MES4922_110152 [Mesorhizobium ventifaucium]|uniref:Uncharacterized protein n=1 Tax=Mesorhizobium ventifaucium TaxID=666020 RepID=A0ABM9DFU6_9HYPH|nr:hypothetical protein MES4922_110152 [Mesorhizobium ventifaucium]